MSAGILTTDRLVLSPLCEEDADFVVELLNEPPFLRYIGDKGVRSSNDARHYLQSGPLASYRQHGFGLLRVGLAADATPIGMCGLLKRDNFDVPDLGFAFLQRYWGHGYAQEAAVAVMQHAWQTPDLPRVLAIVTPENESSIALLEKLGFASREMIRMPGENADICLYSCHRQVGQ